MSIQKAKNWRSFSWSYPTEQAIRVDKFKKKSITVVLVFSLDFPKSLIKLYWGIDPLMKYLKLLLLLKLKRKKLKKNASNHFKYNLLLSSRQKREYVYYLNPAIFAVEWFANSSSNKNFRWVKRQNKSTSFIEATKYSVLCCFFTKPSSSSL